MEAISLQILSRVPRYILSPFMYRIELVVLQLGESLKGLVDLVLTHFDGGSTLVCMPMGFDAYSQCFD